MTKLIAIGGSQGTGKTYLARGVTNHLNEKGHSSEYVSEVAREWIGRFGIPADVADQLDIFEMQLQKEESAMSNESLDYIVVDSPLYLPYIYGVLVTDMNNLKEQFRIQRLFSRVLKYSPRYEANIILLHKKHEESDDHRVWDNSIEEVTTNGILFFVKALGLRNIHEVDANLNFEERVKAVSEEILTKTKE